MHLHPDVALVMLFADIAVEEDAKDNVETNVLKVVVAIVVDIAAVTVAVTVADVETRVLLAAADQDVPIPVVIHVKKNVMDALGVVVAPEYAKLVV